MLCFVAKRYILQQVSEEVNRKGPARNTTVQLSIPTPNLSTTMDRETDTQTDRQTDDIIVPPSY